MKIKILLLAILLVGCSPQKRLNRLITKHPYLAKKDSVKIYDTIEHLLDLTINRVKWNERNRIGFKEEK